MSCPRASDVAPWVLGALDEPEAAGFAEHLGDCPHCPGEIAMLQTVADTLPLAAEQVAPPPALKDRIMRVVESEAELLRVAGPEADRAPARRGRDRSSRRWLPFDLRPLPAMALAAVILALGAAGGVLFSQDGTSSSTRVVQANVTMPGAAATVRVLDGHARLFVRGMRNPAPGRVYQVWLQRGSGPLRPTDALFTVSEGGHGHVEVPGSVQPSDRILVTSEPRGGSAQPTTSPVITARV